MRKLLLATAVTLVLSTPAWADNIVLTATVDGIVVDTFTSINGNLNVTNASFGPFFNLNTLTINSATFLAPPGFLSTNTLDVNQSGTGDHTLVLDIQAQGLTGPSALTDLLSEFSVTGLTSGWTGREQTFINGTALSDTGIFTANSSADDTAVMFLGNPFTAEAVYTITSDGVGRFNGGIDISAVPGPVVGAGLPGLLVGCVGFAFLARRRRNVAA